MAISSTPSLLEIEAEFGGSGLVDCANKAGLTLPVGMMQFAGLSAELILFENGVFSYPNAFQVYNSNDAGIARVSGNYIELGCDAYSRYIDWWGKVAIDLNSADLSGYSTVHITWEGAGTESTSQMEKALHVNKSDIQFGVQETIGNTTYLDFSWWPGSWTYERPTLRTTSGAMTSGRFLNIAGLVSPTVNGTFQWFARIHQIKLT